MTDDNQSNGSITETNVRSELMDSFDEELEEEIDDNRLREILNEASEHPFVEGADRIAYFKELFRLQRELIKLQDWIFTNKKKAVIIFEGRDAAGKGGVIKRITQRLPCHLKLVCLCCRCPWSQ